MIHENISVPFSSLLLSVSFLIKLLEIKMYIIKTISSLYLNTKLGYNIIIK